MGVKERERYPVRIVLMSGGVETLTYFSREMGETFISKGCRVFYFDMNHKEKEVHRLRKFIRMRETVLVTFNFIGLCEEEFIFHPQYGYVWEQYEIPIYNIVVDHPLYYHNHLKNPQRNYHHIGIDRNHIKYVEKYYPNVQVCGFLPLAGTSLRPEEEWPDWEKRKIPVLMSGNYKEPGFFDTYIERLDEEYTAFYHRIIDNMLLQPERELEEVALEACVQEMGGITDEDFRHVLASMNFIDLYVRNSERGNVVRMLVDHGIAVEVVGSGWEKLNCLHPENLHIHKMTDSRTCLELTGCAKILLNVMPGFKDGAHDRIFNAILNGAVSLSDRSAYLKEILPEGCGICYYQMERLEELPELTKHILSCPQEAVRVIHTGYAKVKESHTWKNRAQQLLEWIYTFDWHK